MPLEMLTLEPPACAGHRWESELAWLPQSFLGGHLLGRVSPFFLITWGPWDPTDHGEAGLTLHHLCCGHGGQVHLQALHLGCSSALGPGWSRLGPMPYDLSTL